MRQNKKQDKPVKIILRVKDTVIKISGKDKGKSGEIIAINKKNNTLLVKGINLRAMRQKPSQENPKGGVIDIEQPIHISNVMLYDSKAKKGTRIKIDFITDKKKTKKVRISKRTQKEI
jgi:large subunit ribosomal protein L24